jgi:hypothetical protein
MAFSSTTSTETNLPTDYFTGYLYLTSEASGNEITVGSSIVNSTDYVLIPRAQITGLIAAEAATATGNGNKLIYGLVKAAYTALQAESAASRPETLTLTEGSVSGATATTYRQSITMQALFDISASDIADES